MQEQLRRLAEMAALSAMTLQVLPMTVGEHVGMSGPFTIYHFESPEDPDVVYLEHPRGDLYLEHPEQVEPYIQGFEQLQALAQSPAKSAALIARLVRELK